MTSEIYKVHKNENWNVDNNNEQYWKSKTAVFLDLRNRHANIETMYILFTNCEACKPYIFIKLVLIIWAKVIRSN